MNEFKESLYEIYKDNGILAFYKKNPTSVQNMEPTTAIKMD